MHLAAQPAPRCARGPTCRWHSADFDFSQVEVTGPEVQNDVAAAGARGECALDDEGRRIVLMAARDVAVQQRQAGGSLPGFQRVVLRGADGRGRRPQGEAVDAVQTLVLDLVDASSVVQLEPLELVRLAEVDL